MDEEIVEEVKNFVKRECEKPSSNYGSDPYEFHFKKVAEHAKQLADELDADKEIVTIAAWLHDIGSIKHGREEHHLTGARIAEEKLEELNYPREKIERVKECIKNHRGSVENDRETLEEKIVAEADAMSNFDNISGLFKAAFAFEDKNQGEAQESVKNKLERKWNRLHFDKSREIIKPKYNAAMTLLD